MSNNYCEVCNNLKVLENNSYKYINGSITSYSIDTIPRCSFTTDAWHRQAAAIKNLIKKTPSRKLINLMEEELKEIITNRKVTLDDYI